MERKSVLRILGNVTHIEGALHCTDLNFRGRLVMNWQLFGMSWCIGICETITNFIPTPLTDAFGIFLGFAANLIVSQTGDNRWRYEVASVILPTVVLLR